MTEIEWLALGGEKREEFFLSSFHSLGIYEDFKLLQHFNEGVREISSGKFCYVLGILKKEFPQFSRND